MTFDTERKKVGRRPITIVEVDVDACANTYGVAPCTAAIGTTGTQKCFNCFKTCQDQANFVKTTKTYSFCTNSSFLPFGQNLLPCVEKMDIAPTQLDPKGLSVNSSATVTMTDFTHHDRGVDPYVSTRTYNPEEQGTFFGRFRARNPYLVNRPMRVKTAYIDENRNVVSQSRTYFVDRMEGPDAQGSVRLIGKGLLKFADDDKAQIPALSTGSLSASLTNSATSFTLTPTGVGANYPTSGKVRIDDEVIAFTSRTGDTISGCTRGSNSTTAAAHDASTLVQLCLVYTSKTPADVLYDALVNYASVPTSYITKTDWDDECTNWLPGFSFSTVITEPKGVSDLISDLLQSCGAAMWWDEINEQIRFKVLVPFQVDGEITLLNELDNVIADSVSQRDLEKDRLSRVIIHFGSTNVLKDPDKNNSPFVLVSVDNVNEGGNAYGVPVSLEFSSRWVQTLTVAQGVATRILVRYGVTPVEITFTLDAKDASLKTGDLFDLQSRLLQSIYGDETAVRFIVTQCSEVEIGSQYQYVALQISQQSGGKAYGFADTTTPAWGSASSTEKSKYFFLSDDAGLMPDGSVGATLV